MSDYQFNPMTSKELFEKVETDNKQSNQPKTDEQFPQKNFSPEGQNTGRRAFTRSFSVFSKNHFGLFSRFA